MNSTSSGFFEASNLVIVAVFTPGNLSSMVLGTSSTSASPMEGLTVNYKFEMHKRNNVRAMYQFRVGGSNIGSRAVNAILIQNTLKNKC